VTWPSLGPRMLQNGPKSIRAKFHGQNSYKLSGTTIAIKLPMKFEE
jgi:hypothetical protein